MIAPLACADFTLHGVVFRKKSKSPTRRRRAVSLWSLRGAGEAYAPSIFQGRQNVPAVVVEPDRLDPTHCRERQRPVEMGKYCAAAGGLPFQHGAERLCVHRDDDEAGHAGEVLARGGGDLGGGGEMDVAVGIVDRAAAEYALALGVAPLLVLADLVDRGHGAPPGSHRSKSLWADRA